MTGKSQEGHVQRPGPAAVDGYRFDLAPLHHWTWWLALGVLFVNDNLLKGKGVAPTWLTGKLSDFAFLIVAPVLLTALIPVAIPARRGIAFATVVGLFVGADLSPTFSEALVHVAGQLGLRWRLWPDVTDLVALIVLPWAWVLTGTRGRGEPRRSFRSRAGVLVGAIACLATSAPPRSEAPPFLINESSNVQTISLTWLLRQPDCNAAGAQALAATLNPGDFSETESVTLAPGTNAPLSGSPNWRKARLFQPAQADCVGVLVAVENGPSALAVARPNWTTSDDDGSFIQCSSAGGTSAGTNVVALVARDGRLQLEAGYPLGLVAVNLAEVLARSIPPGSCRSLRDEFRSRVDQAAGCTVDSDCQAVRALPIFGEPCAAHVNRGVASDFGHDLIRQWTTGGQCVSDQDSECRDFQPSVCRAGRCEAACPGAQLPRCPQDCPAGANVLAGATCRASDCQTDSGDVCACESGVTRCSRVQPPIDGCPLSCVRTGTSLPLPGPQATDGGPNDAAGDAIDEAGSGLDAALKTEPG